MIKVETSVVINRPSDEIFAYISNLEQSAVAVRLKELLEAPAQAGAGV